MPAPTLSLDDLKALETKSAGELLAWGYQTFGDRIAFASSFGAEDVVVLDHIAKFAPKLRVFTLDTGRLHEETYDVMERVRAKYGLQIEVTFPDQAKIEALERAKGFYSMRVSIENRKECCNIRKVEPLKRVLSSVDAWITGLRREQAVTRTDTPKAEVDQGFGGIIKLNPIIEWSEAEVWDYIKKHDVPYNALHDRSFPSIGCSPCTRAIAAGEDVRAGRWWWENPEQKECGLHVKKH
ncbi:MAG: phosphoadenylyl-sulfate reductase [Candidatus Eisenbacteria bacterium]